MSKLNISLTAAQCGFNIGCLGIPVWTDIKVLNMKSAFQFPQVIESILQLFKSTLNTFYMDAVIPMGCASSCANFESCSTAIEWVAEHKRV